MNLKRWAHFAVEFVLLLRNFDMVFREIRGKETQIWINVPPVWIQITEKKKYLRYILNAVQPFWTTPPPPNIWEQIWKGVFPLKTNVKYLILNLVDSGNAERIWWGSIQVSLNTGVLSKYFWQFNHIMIR